MEYKCKICGEVFEAERGNHVYCSDECRRIGTRQTRIQWEHDTQYGKRQKKAYRKKRKKAVKAISKPVSILTESIDKRAENGNLAARLQLARESGDQKAYWKIYRRYEIDIAERQGRFSPCQVNGISVYHPQFVELVIDSIKREQRIAITNNRG